MVGGRWSKCSNSVYDVHTFFLFKRGQAERGTNNLMFYGIKSVIKVNITLLKSVKGRTRIFNFGKSIIKMYEIYFL